MVPDTDDRGESQQQSNDQQDHPKHSANRHILLVMPDRSRKRPRDLNAMAKSIVDDATGEAPPEPDEPQKDPAAVELGRRGGLKGGPARAKKLSARKRTEIAKRAAQARWGKKSR